jgi:dephospho-CoA kinase
MKIIGITGGIGSGKTTVTEFLKGKGYQVVDADMIARKIVEPGTEVLGQLVSHFGGSILHNDGSLNRKRLAELAFVNPAKKDELDWITHGAILENITQEINNIRIQLNPKLVFVDAALLIETGLYKKMDEVWLVTAHEALRIQRVVARDRLDAERVKQRIRAQMSDEQKARHSFRIINNAGTKEELYNALEKILREYETV